MAALPEEHQVAGFRSMEYPVIVVLLRFQLLGLVEGAEAGDVDFEAWRKAVDELNPKEQDDAHRQHLAFMRTVICMQEVVKTTNRGPRTSRWSTCTGSR